MTTEPQAVPSVWAREAPRRRSTDALGRDQIVAAAAALLDAEGADALSMRRLGARLGAGATSLYWHVANKDELMELVVDAAFGELALATDPEGWRPAATQAAHAVREVMHRHPWLASAVGEAGLAYLGPNLMGAMDRMLAIFVDAGFPLLEAGRAVSAVIAYVLGVASGESAWQATVARSGTDERTLLHRLWPAAESAAQRYPMLRDLYAVTRDVDVDEDREGEFAYGLERLLDGLAARLH